MLRQSALITLFIIFTPLARPHPTTATAGKTDDVLIVAGGLNERRIKAQNILNVGTDESLIFGGFSIASRINSELPIELRIWSRGAGDMSFIDLTPLLGVFDEPESVSDLRATLFKTNAVAPPTEQFPNDLQQLQSLVNKPPAKNERVGRQRTIALEQMRSFNFSNFEQVFDQYEKQKEFARSSWLSAPPSHLAELIGGIADLYANDDEATKWSKLIRRARDKRLLAPLLSTTIANSTEPKIICYVVILPKDATKMGGEIFIAANGFEAARFPLAVEIQSEESFFTKTYAAIPTTLVGLVATFGGAFIGYKFFLYQQNHLVRIEQEKRFADKKVELSKTIRQWFQNDYGGLRNNQDSELDRARQIRNALIDENIYAILLSDEILKVNNICDPNYEVSGSRLDALDRVLADNFKELMV